jgi:hypothetical protein
MDSDLGLSGLIRDVLKESAERRLRWERLLILDSLLMSLSQAKNLVHPPTMCCGLARVSLDPKFYAATRIDPILHIMHQSTITASFASLTRDADPFPFLNLDVIPAHFPISYLRTSSPNVPATLNVIPRIPIQGEGVF